jgi:MerR family transcriptional regulator, light-induced transcriptional regulator
MPAHDRATAHDEAMPLAAGCAMRGAAGPAGERLALVLQEAVDAAVLPALTELWTSPSRRKPERQGQGVADLDGIKLHVSADEVAAFTARLAHASDAALDGIVACWQQQGLSTEVLLTEALQASARLLGRWWEQDQCDFAAVTAGCARLHRLMHLVTQGGFRSLVTPRPLALSAARPPRIWMGLSPSEQHRFGWYMAGELFRRAGWDVIQSIPEENPSPRAVVKTLLGLTRHTRVDAIGFAVGGEKQMAWVKDVVDNLRCNAKLSSHLVLLGGPLVVQHSQALGGWGADLLCTQGELAPWRARQWLRDRALGEGG